MGKFSRDKGARGERAFCSLCREHGWNATRTAQHSGKTGGMADVIGLPGIHVEVKNVERLNVREALEQAIRDADKESTASEVKMPIVAHKKNNAPWLVTMLADDWFELYREWEAGK